MELQDKELFNKYRTLAEKQAGESEDKAQKRVKREQFGSQGPIMMKGHTGYLTFGTLF